MKSFGILAVIVCVIALLSAFTNSKRMKTLDNYGWYRATPYAPNCTYGHIDNDYWCDASFSGPICTINGIDAYASEIGCAWEMPNVLRQEEF
ncbi:hypothetical protein [Pedobacter heparinus]|uniref:hypothetical protein n=1 Tax=Pedobacter heparinus TaxID=984 RepID=UPI0029300814|nr:hypothetical protein [Pedobacter heparinus]